MKKHILFCCLLASGPAFAQTVFIPSQQSQPATSTPMTTRDFAEKALEDAQRASERRATENGPQDQAMPSQSPSQSPSQAVPPFGQPSPDQPSISQEPKRPPSDAEMIEARRLLWMVDTSQSLRQSGGRLERPLNRGVYYSSSPSDKFLVDRWILQLKNEGFGEDKVIFEAKRLSKDDFERWASRLLWSEQKLHPNFTDVNY